MSTEPQSIASQIRRRLPGKAVLDSKGNVDFRRGRIIYSSPRIQYVEADHPIHKLVFLVGSTYMYWCPACTCTVWEQELHIFRDAGGVLPPGHCPFCCGPLRRVQPGDKVRLHYRYDHRALSHGDWWAERWNW